MRLKTVKLDDIVNKIKEVLKRLTGANKERIKMGTLKCDESHENVRENFRSFVLESCQKVSGTRTEFQKLNLR